MKRLANYRCGDRAELFGAVPRQEDFRIVDAVATILRPDGRYLSAEDSFAVQFKSRTERHLEYLNERFDALLHQELGVFIARVDLRRADVKVYSVGAALLHPNINDMKGLVAYLDARPMSFEDGVLHASLDPPVLHLNSCDLGNKDQQEHADSVMKRWLELDRWNANTERWGFSFRSVGGQTRCPLKVLQA